MSKPRLALCVLLIGVITSIVTVATRTGRTAARVVTAAAPVDSSCSASYDAVNDFSATSNPNGAWSYGWEPALGGSLTVFTSEQTIYEGLDAWVGPDTIFGGNYPLVSRNHTGATLNYGVTVSHPPNMLNVNPSFTGKLSVVRWTAPTSGAFSVTGLFQGIDTVQTDTDVHIRQNGSTALFDGRINGVGVQTPFNLIVKCGCRRHSRFRRRPR